VVRREEPGGLGARVGGEMRRDCYVVRREEWGALGADLATQGISTGNGVKSGAPGLRGRSG